MNNNMAAHDWREENGIICFEVMTNCLTGREWIERLEEKDFYIGMDTKHVLMSNDFIPGFSGIKIKIVVLKGDLFKDDERITENIIKLSSKLGCIKPDPEIACLIREMFSDDDLNDMGLYYIVAMHEPINNSLEEPSLLGAHRYGNYGRLSACSDWIDPDFKWNNEIGFAFVLL